MKVVVLAAEGVAAEPLAELGGKTPLDCARTPHLDAMAARGILGLTRTLPRGLPPGSEIATLAVLGYDPAAHAVGRAPFEALGRGVALAPTDVAFRCDLVTIEAGEDGAEIMRDAAGGGLGADEGTELARELGRALARDGLELHPGQGHRHLLVWRRGESAMRTVPPQALAGKPVAAALPEGPGAEVLRDLMARARTLLAAHPLCAARRARSERAPTALWPWGQGVPRPLPSLRDRLGVEGAFLADAPLAVGLGLAAGLVRVAAPAGDLRARVERGLEALGARDLLFVHVAVGEEGLVGDSGARVEAIERLDAEVVGPLLEGLRQRDGEWRILVLAEQAGAGARPDEPVPFAVTVARDAEKTRALARGFNEREARELGIFIPEAHTFLERLCRR